MTITARATSVRLPAMLSLLAGVTDVTSWILLGGFFSAHVTGNLVVIAADLVTGRTPDLAAALAVPLFVLVTLVATAIARRAAWTNGRPGAESARAVTMGLLGSQAVLLLLAAALSFTTHASLDPKQPIAVLIGLLAVAAMAAQNAYLHLVPPKAASTAVMTGNLVAASVAGMDLILSRGRSASALAAWSRAWPLLAGFVGGCLIGAVAATLFGDHAAVVPAVISCAVLLGVSRSLRVS
jgi:uncharacterized membrane protein YoaK (UPF0700 family)